jgi:hypothetical protein
VCNQQQSLDNENAQYRPGLQTRSPSTGFSIF